MLMQRNLEPVEERDKTYAVSVSALLKREAFTPLSRRIAPGQSELSAGLDTLKGLLGAADFDRYIESLISLRLQDQALWLITDRAMHRSILERRFIPQLKTAFGVSRVRIISQS
ncbi:MAG TPA: hypothetical protein PKA10_20255 [Selenomonadales bacterium]|nr:hypothetical protein [Selenomonadales bacterium]